MTVANNTLSIALVKDLMSYDPATGNFQRKEFKPGWQTVKPFAGHKRPGGYTTIHVAGKNVMAHRLAWAISHGEWPPHEVDHINGDTHDNRLCNLRLATRQQNMRNLPPRNNTKHKYKGVSYHAKDNRYMAYISLDGKKKYLGSKKTAIEAHELYVEAARTLFGDFCNAAFQKGDA